MKKALVLALVCAFGLSAGAFAGPLTGFWNTNIVLDLNPFDLDSFSSVLGIDYTVSGWSLGMTTVFVDIGLIDLYFEASGQLGAFTIGSYLNFDPAKLFQQWLTGVKVNIAGVSLYGFFDLAQCSTQTPTLVGSGWLFGVEGGAGDFTFRGEAYFNLAASLIGGGYTFDDVVGGFADFAYAFDPIHGCTSITVAEDAFALETCGDCLCFSGVDIEIGFPFACVDSVLLDVSFTDDGFQYFKLMLNDIYLSTDWLYIDDFDITWSMALKTVTVDLKLQITQACLTPYFGILNPAGGIGSSSGIAIDQIELYALGLTYSFNGVTFKSMTLLDTTNYSLTWGGTPVRKALCGTANGSYCCTTYDELVEIIVDSDACCGGAFSFDVKNWFDVGNAGAGIFGWTETSVDFSIGIGSNFAITMMLDIDIAGAQLWGMGFNVSW